MAFANFSYNYATYLNRFNDITKDRYLSYQDRSNKDIMIMTDKSNNVISK